MRALIIAGALFAASAPALSQGTPVLTKPQDVYYEFQVERVARVAKDTEWPAYPAALKNAKIEGEVLATFVVDTLGMVDSTTFSALKSTNELFSQAVRAGLSRMKFEPALIGGRKVKQLVQVPFVFKIAH